MKEKVFTTKKIVLMGMLGALAAVLMLWEVPLLFIAPSFYGLDFSEIPILVGTFAMGPLAGFIMEVVKILIKLVIKPTSTGFVGEFANLAIGLALVLPAGMIYKKIKSKKGAIIGMITGTLCMSIIGMLLNVFIMIPFYSNFMPIEAIIQAGAAINPIITDIWSFALICVAPFNAIKGILVSLVTALIYKRLSKVIHSAV